MTAPSTERNFPTPEFACQPPSPRTDKGGKLEVGRQASLLVTWSLVTPPFLPRIWWLSNRSADPRRWGLRFFLRFTHPIPKADPRRCDLRFFARRAADLNSGGLRYALVTQSSRHGLRPFARYAGCDVERVTRKGLVERPEDRRWSSCDHFALDKATVGACPIQIDDVRSPLGYRAGEKPTVRTPLTAACIYPLGRMPRNIPAAIIVAGNGYEWEHAHQLVGNHEPCRGSGST